MLDKIKAYLSALFGLRRGWLADFRLWILAVPALFVLSIDTPVMDTLLYSLTAMLVVVALAHVMRRILFHYIDLEVVFDKATESPQGAGLVFLGICLVILAFVLGTALWIAK